VPNIFVPFQPLLDVINRFQYGPIQNFTNPFHGSQVDRQTDVTKPKGTFHDYANTLINSMRHSLLYWNEQIT